MKKKRTPKRQFGGFNLPPSLMELFTNGAPSFDQVMALASQLDSGAGTDVFSRAFAEDNPDLITGEVTKQGSFAQAAQDNESTLARLMKADPAWLKFASPEYKGKLEDQLAFQNKMLGTNELIRNTNAFTGANQMYDLLGSWFGQQGGSPFGGIPMEGGAVTWEEAKQLTAEDAKFIRSLKDDPKGKEKAIAILVDMGYGEGDYPLQEGEGPEDVIKHYKEIRGINASPSRGADNKLDPGFLNFLAEDYKTFQYEQWGLNPRELKKMEVGGKALSGYADNSPYKNSPEIVIPGDNITMANTGMPLIGVPDVGDPRLMPPYSGTHVFPGASMVKEVPAGKKGGIHIDPAKKGTFKAQATRMGMSVQEAAAHILANTEKYSPAMVKKANFARNFAKEEGGTIVDDNSKGMKKGGRKKRMVPYYQPGGPGQEGTVPPIGVQLEESEVFSTPDLDIIDTNARKKHESMDKDFITDVIRPDDYVFSADPSMKVTRKRAEKVSFGLGPVHYKEGEIGDIPEEVTAADIMPKGEDEMIIADYVKEVRKKYPMSERDDMFSRKTNDANKSSRIPLLAAATLFNEEKRTKGKAPMTGFASRFENRFENTYTAGSGVDTTENQYVAFGEIPSYQEVLEGKKGGDMVPHGQFGMDVVGSLINLGTSIFGAAKAGKNKKIAVNALQADRPQINQLARTEGLYSDLSYGAQMAGLAAQDPTVQAPQYDSTQLDARARSVSPSLFNVAAARAMAGNRPFLDTLFKNTSDFSEAVNAYSPVQAASLSTLADLGMGEVEKNLALENQYRDQKQNFSDRQILADVTAKNATLSNANSLTGALANTMGAGISSRGRIAASRLNALRSNALQQAQAKIDSNTAIGNAVQNVGVAAANAGYTYEASRSGQDPGVNNNISFRSDTTSPSVAMNSPTSEGYGKPIMTADGRELWPVWKDGKIVYVEIQQ